MNQQQNSNDFEERLLERLRAVVAERGAEAAEPVASSPTWRRRALRPALAGAGVAAVAGATLLVLAGGDDTSSAYAVEPQDGGQIRVEIRSLEDAKGLQEALDEAGVPADVNYVPAGTACREPRFTPANAPTHKPLPDEEATTKRPKTTMGMLASPGGKTVFTISRDTVAPGQTLVLTAAPGPDGKGTTVQTAVAEGSVAPCVQVPSSELTPPADTEPPAPLEGGTDSGPSTNQSSGAGSGPSLSRHPG